MYSMTNGLLRVKSTKQMAAEVIVKGCRGCGRCKVAMEGLLRIFAELLRIPRFGLLRGPLRRKDC